MLLLWLAVDLMDELLRTDGMPIAEGMAECRLLNLALILAAKSAIPAFGLGKEKENEELFPVRFPDPAIQLMRCPPFAVSDLDGTLFE